MINLRKYAIVFVLTVLGLMAVGYALGAIGITVPAGLNTWLPAATAAVVVGQQLAKETGTALSSGTYWRLGVPTSVVATALHAAIASIIFLGLFVTAGVNMFAQIAAVGAFGLAIIGLIVVLAIYLSNVCFLWLGVKNGLRVKSAKADDT
ncbi:hypothetical protein BXY66_3132 [Shimia isoporae]|uniref:Uncharacterized protein n=1 Tax=Shimia isoporae TaxID=647720 RepID=A0A4R1N2F8_9RHOB|nr:ABZJ_00895 family protein [Shimia isoporae]TCL00489.1 hypothetical protein BXY66_3132 [Shimia isoporae]